VLSHKPKSGRRPDQRTRRALSAPCRKPKGIGIKPLAVPKRNHKGQEWATAGADPQVTAKLADQRAVFPRHMKRDVKADRVTPAFLPKSPSTTLRLSRSACVGFGLWLRGQDMAALVTSVAMPTPDFHQGSVMDAQQRDGEGERNQ